MSEFQVFKICPDYKREGFDFCEIQRDKNNPIDSRGYPLYPFVLPSSHGSSYTRKINKDLYFKRKQQDGNNPAAIFSQHHHNKQYNELAGTFDDLAEVICYILAKNIISPKTGEPIIKTAEYALATYTDEEDVLLRGCITKNIVGENEQLLNMAEIMNATQINAKNMDGYLEALQKYCTSKKWILDIEKVKRDLLKNSYYCWKVANSDNHKNNITFLVKSLPSGERELVVSELIDNGSAYELSSPYHSASNPDKARIEVLLEDDNFSKVNENGERVFDFPYYPYMHTAFHLNNDKVLVQNTKIGDKSFSYEYALAGEMLSDDNLLYDISQIEQQFDIDKMIAEIDELYGSGMRDNPKKLNWPPLLKEYMHATNAIKSKTMSYIVADYYLQTAYKACIEDIDVSRPTELYKFFSDVMHSMPIQESKQAYDLMFLKIAEAYGVKFDVSKLASLKFNKDSAELAYQNQPN